jgi:hypothetical protein
MKQHYRSVAASIRSFVCESPRYVTLPVSSFVGRVIRSGELAFTCFQVSTLRAVWGASHVSLSCLLVMCGYTELAVVLLMLTGNASLNQVINVL